MVYRIYRYLLIDTFHHLIIQFQEPQNLILVIGLVNLENVTFFTLFINKNVPFQ